MKWNMNSILLVFKNLANITFTAYTERLVLFIHVTFVLCVIRI